MILVFDYDGTLHDTAPIYGHAIRYAHHQMVLDGVATEQWYSDEYLSRYLGYSIEDMWRDFAPQLVGDQWRPYSIMAGDQLHECILQHKATLYPGVSELLTTLKAQGHTLLILSNCSMAYLEAHRIAMDLDQWFSGYYCGEQYHWASKDIIFKEIMAAYPGPYLMIGDRESDVSAGYLNGINTIACSYGYGSEQEWRNATTIVTSVPELSSAISRMSTNDSPLH